MTPTSNDNTRAFSTADYTEVRLSQHEMIEDCGVLEDPGPDYAVGLGMDWDAISKQPSLKHNPAAAGLAALITMAAAVEQRDVLLVATVISTPWSVIDYVLLANDSFDGRWYEDVYPRLRALLRVDEPDDDKVGAILDEFIAEVLAEVDNWRQGYSDDEASLAV